MGRKCVVQGCLARNTALHIFPDRNTDPERYTAWVQFVQARRGNSWQGPTSSRTSVCSEHFTPDCFLNLMLMKTAVPSIYPYNWEIDGDDVSACKLQEVSSTSTSRHSSSSSPDEVRHLLAANQELRSQIKRLEEDNKQLRVELDSRLLAMSTQEQSTPTPRTSTRSISIQTTPACRSKGIQVQQSQITDATNKCRFRSSCSSRTPSMSTPSIKKRRLEESESPLLSTGKMDSTYHIEDDISVPNTGTSTTSSSQCQLRSEVENKYVYQCIPCTFRRSCQGESNLHICLQLDECYGDAD